MDAHKVGLVEEKFVESLERYRIYVAVAVVVIHRGVVAVGFKKEDVGKLGFVKGKEAHEGWGLST
jgi:glutathionyl-hydroquinone reductase